VVGRLEQEQWDELDRRGNNKGGKEGLDARDGAGGLEPSLQGGYPRVVQEEEAEEPGKEVKRPGEDGNHATYAFELGELRQLERMRRTIER
jgi:hypothetical protein